MEQAQLKREVAAAKRGSSAAFGRLYAAYAADLYRFALWFVHNESDAEDAVQEAMLSAWENIRALKKEEAFRSWLFKILANACKTQLRSKGRLTVVSIDGAPVAETLAYAPAFENDAVGSLLSALSAEDRAIVTMAVLGDFKSGEIGEALGMKSGTVRSRLSRALQTLRTQIETEGATV